MNDYEATELIKKQNRYLKKWLDRAEGMKKEQHKKRFQVESLFSGEKLI